jgi:hypothetical protein
VLPDQLLQVALFLALHGEEGPVVRDAGVVDGHDAEVLQPRVGQDLDPEGVFGLVVAEVASQDHLERLDSAQLKVLDLADNAHTAAAERADVFVFAVVTTITLGGGPGRGVCRLGMPPRCPRACPWHGQVFPRNFRLQALLRSRGRASLLARRRAAWLASS